MSKPTDPSAIAHVCLTRLQAIVPELDPATISPEVSLTEELMLDSFMLASLVDGLQHDFDDVDLTAWLMSATREGGDTIAALVEFVVGARRAGG